MSLLSRLALRHSSLLSVVSLLALCAGRLPATRAVTITDTTATNHSHDQFMAGDTPRSPFFTSSVNSDTAQVYTIGPSNGLAGSIAAPGGTPTGSSTTTSGTITINGTATSVGVDATPGTADDWLNGNQIPVGVTLSFNASFTWSSANGNTLITAAGNTGNGLSISDDNVQTHGDLNVGEVLNISPITTSNHQWAGAPTEPFTFTPISVGITRFTAFRSNSFTEASEGATLSDGTNSWAFGNAPAGTVASNLIMDNNLSNQFSPAGGNVPLTFTTNAGAWNLKGFQIRTPISYEIVAIPTPSDADFDDDGDVDGADFVTWQRNFGMETGAVNQQGDADNNGTVDAVDLGLWRENFGQGGSTPEAVAIPEPAAVALAGLGLLAVIARCKAKSGRRVA
jgi:hypothetical protein